MHAFRFNSKGSRSCVDLLPPERTPRPATKAGLSRPLDIVDVEFETVSTVARRGPYPVFNDNSRVSDAEHARRSPAIEVATVSLPVKMLLRLETLLQRASPKTFAALVAGICASTFVFLVGLPGGAAAVATPPLVLAGVKTSVNEANGMKVLSVYGTVENRSDAPKAVPTILVDVIANGKRVTASRVLAATDTLAAGESRPFSTRLLHTGGKLPDVSVSFGKPGASAP
ncbi:FxLYD domain-containing protein [Pararhizobium antarcticum]|uniref:DUF3426 domain-containing protein n=1 Tax=Pararhizobium antarcticum TaxID=1798805 RepID=A0A657LNE8_9HYPH|nr:FxLYD domain-containing protein [Pararhizobium antarcticum]OJF92293.1 hypothetical protein AX760_06125 [Pararhizobium antarcticum]OJF94826.1 hypothetical protein AX761_04180 [Rhizobium sp. 58]